MYNKVIMLGRIRNDLEIKTTSSGVSVLSFSIAVDRRYKEKGAEKKSDFCSYAELPLPEHDDHTVSGLLDG